MIVVKVTEYESEDDFIDEIEPVMDHGWHLMSDPFSDTQPDLVPMFSASADNFDPVCHVSASFYVPT
ncbi:hypothetical protein E2C01_047321 [Portunus trituberculatus]|uniref:Uncharacterized protein n=1 Tax=Portunus trituberculatus TaxID=210409 RepID=A0A5B7G0T9_PORTR|nr:hypothetical protein [Portunus trituberculatus]